VTALVDNAAARRAYEPSGFVIGGTTTWSRHGRTLDESITGRLAVPRHDSRLPRRHVSPTVTGLSALSAGPAAAAMMGRPPAGATQWSSSISSTWPAPASREWLET
jgi:hypothetical protein